MSNDLRLTAIIAPCGLNCAKCLAYENGAIREHSQALRQLLGPNFDAYAERFTAMEPAFRDWPGFKRLLEFLSQGRCGGCRKNGCLFTACGVHVCIKDKGVNFCFECAEFPCTNHGLPPILEQRWRQNNENLKQIGIDRYFEKTKDLPRYP
ncbi:MAG: DUF3795 domain-containing protein [Desulfobacteraceae bacterium]|nr:MAG: DUF3795 domain-containing protein [Desulfobacteraceae bacterium]